MTNGISKRALELIARDAMVEGRIEEGYAQLRANDASISRLRTVTREASVLLLAEYRVMEATLALTTCRTLFDTLCYEMGQRVDPKVGDILVASWGYDQTNIDYYQVIAVTRSSVRIREIGCKVTGGSRGTDEVAPVPGSWVKGHPMRPSDLHSDKGALRRFRQSGSDYAVSVDDCATAYPWDGRPRHATASGYGH